MRAPRPSANEQEAGRPRGRGRINTREYMGYCVTGVTVEGKRFKRNTDNIYYAFGINLYRGSVWGIRPSGARVLLKRVYN
jgi:hypothetical protein